jgi:hypothetical protein
MIWIFENLSKKEIENLSYLNPLMDFKYSMKEGYLFKTFCSGTEIKEGYVQDIRKIRLFNIENMKQGLICDDIKQAKELSLLINGEIASLKYTDIKDSKVVEYIEESNNNWIDWLAVSVKCFMQYSKDSNISLSNLLDIGELKRYNIDYHNYFPRKAFED